MMNTKHILWIDDEADTEIMDSKVDIITIHYPMFNFNLIKGISQALDEINTNLDKYDLIIVDLIMPPRDIFSEAETNFGSDTGISLIRKIREVNNSMPIVIISQKLEKSVSHKLMKELNISDFIEKGVSPMETGSEIFKHL